MMSLEDPNPSETNCPYLVWYNDSYSCENYQFKNMSIDLFRNDKIQAVLKKLTTIGAPG